MAAEFDGKIDVPEAAIQIMDDNVIGSGLAPPALPANSVINMYFVPSIISKSLVMVFYTY